MHRSDAGSQARPLDQSSMLADSECPGFDAARHAAHRMHVIKIRMLQVAAGTRAFSEVSATVERIAA